MGSEESKIVSICKFDSKDLTLVMMHGNCHGSRQCANSNYFRIPCGASNKHSIDVEVRLVSFNKTSAEEYGYKDDESKNFNINRKTLSLFHGHNEFSIVATSRHIKGDFRELSKKKHLCQCAILSKIGSKNRWVSFLLRWSLPPLMETAP